MPSPKRSPILDLTWEQLPDLDTPLSKHPCAVYAKGVIYVGGATAKDHAQTIFTYNPDAPEAWGKLPNCPRKNFGMASMGDTIVIVGGVDSAQRKSNKVTVWDATAQQWKEGFYPSLYNARSSPLVTTYENWLLVVGGTTDGKPLSVVEKFNTTSGKSWSLCPPLPEKCTNISQVVIDHTLFVSGGMEGAPESNYAVYSVLLQLLVRIKPKTKDETIWNKLPSVPNLSSTLCSISRKTLLAVGGEVDFNSSLSALSPILGLNLKREASSGGGKWERVGSLPCQRTFCTCLKLGGNKVAILGGLQVQSAEGTRRVDIGTLQSQR